MRELKNNLTTGKNTKNIQSKKAKSFGYQILGFGSGGAKKIYAMDYLVVAGGGGSGGGGAGGGGAGGYRASGYGPAPLRGCALNVEAGCYSVTIGAGGTAAPAPAYSQGATPGCNSIFNPGGVEGCNMITATGGGESGGQSGRGFDGGSGGGGGLFSSGNPNNCGRGLGNTPPFSPPQGNNGGYSTAAHIGGIGGGGGGAVGAGTPGPTPGPKNQGDGGDGAPNTINSCGTPFTRTTFAGGGAGNACGGSGVGGLGGGGNPNTSGCVNSGGGAGGGNPGLCGGGDGGSGVVILRFPACATICASPACNATATHPGGDKIATFKVSGTLTVS